MVGYAGLFSVVAAVVLGSIAIKSVSPSIVDSIKVQKVDSQIIQTQKAIFEAVQRYMTLEGTHPASMNDLIVKNYFPSIANTNGFGGTYSFAIDAAKGTLTISTEIPDAFARSSFINSYKNTFRPVQGAGDYVNTTYVLPTSVIHGNGQFMTGIPVQSTAPNASTNKYWYDTSGTEAILKMSDGSSWKAVASATSSSGGTAPTTISSISSSSSTLPTSADEGTLKYVYDSQSNTIQQYAYYNGGWVLAGGGGNISSSPKCPSYFALIPGTENIDGASKGWCVAQYEMTPFNTSGWTVSYNAYNYQDAYQTDSSKNVTSRPGYSPINYVSHNNARAMCANRLVDANGTTISGGLPMKYSVYTKLVQDLSLNPNNWSGGAVGSGYVYSGHNDNSPANALTTGMTNTDPYINTGNSSSSGPNQKRILYTSEGDAIWDLAGNLWEQMYEGQNIGGTSTWAEYTAVNDTHPFDPKYITGYAWNSTQGIGKTIYENNAATINSITSASPSYWLLVGGYWNDGSGTGLFASYWHATSLSYRGLNVGVRCIVPAQ